MASREHPQSDGLAERMVQKMKNGLQKTLLTQHRDDWDLLLPYVAMGYRMTQQSSLGYSPYFLLFGRQPIFQAQIQQHENVPLPVGDRELSKFVMERGLLLQ